MKRWLAALALLGLLALMLLGFNRPAVQPLPPPPPAIERIRELGVLVTLAVDVSDVRETAFSGHTGSVQLVLILRGDALLGVDLSQAKIVSADPLTRHAVVVLPKPALTQARIDTERSKVYRIDRSGLWLLRPSDELTARLMNAAMADAQRSVRTTATQPELIERARRQAEQLITAWSNAGGWSVEVRWE